MNYRQIIGEAWAFTQENKKMIVWYAFIPSILTTIVGVLYLLYQFYALKSSVLFENWSESFSVLAVKAVLNVVKDHVDSFVPLFIALAVLALMYFFLPPLSDGAMIQLIARKKNGQDIRIKDGLRYGFMSFLPLFEYSLIARSFDIVVLVFEAVFVLRNLGVGVFELLLPVVIVGLIVSLIFTLIFVFTQYYIVIDGNHIKESMAKSAVLVIKHWDTAIMVSILMIVIALRILLQIVFVLLVPVGIMIFLYFIAASSIPLAGLIIGGIITFIALIFASYMGAIVHVFTSSVWVFTFLQLTNTPETHAREKAEEKIEGV